MHFRGQLAIAIFADFMNLFFDAQIKVVLFHQREWLISTRESIGSTGDELASGNSTDTPSLDDLCSGRQRPSRSQSREVSPEKLACALRYTSLPIYGRRNSSPYRHILINEFRLQLT